MCLGHVDDLPGDRLEVFDLEPQIADGVLGMGIESGADQNEFGLDPVGQGMQAGSERRMVLGLRRAVGQGDVQGVTQSRSGAGFVLAPVPG